MYSYDRIHEWQTRLALVKPNADETARLEISIIAVDLVELSVGVVINHDTIVTYDALSYTWGDAPPSVECDCDGTTILLRDNLAAALKFLRRPQEKRYVWVDFLCINQQDNIEKSFQIPRMRSIYSRASLVVIWLGESRALEDLLRHCKKCRLNTDLLGCRRHKGPCLAHTLEYSWFQRTWVRQEVYAATKLDICCPYFSTSWERFTERLETVKSLWGHFTERLGTVKSMNTAFNQQGLQNQESLNEAFDAVRHPPAQQPVIRLLDLLKQGRGFQASVPHDHIFSVLGMVLKPKDATQLIPVDYNKSYKEVCGDVTRFIIRETRDISILQLCLLQRNRTYAFDWPTMEWSTSQVAPESVPAVFTTDLHRRVLPKELLTFERVLERSPGQSGNQSIDWFDVENPVEGIHTLTLSESRDMSSASSKPVAGRPLVLYGKVWGVLALLPGKRKARSSEVNPQTGRDPCTQVPVYEAKDQMDQSAHSQVEPKGDGEENHKFMIVKRGLIRSGSGEYESKVEWECRGCAREGDIFVSLEPGPRNVLLRRWPGLDELFEIVGWGSGMDIDEDIWFEKFKAVKDCSARSLASVCEGPGLLWWAEDAQDATGPRQRFNIL